MNIYIGNSRLNGNDKTVGKKSCKDVSLVDYFLLSSDGNHQAQHNHLMF
jgi:hypothetical protein